MPTARLRTLPLLPVMILHCTANIARVLIKAVVLNMEPTWDQPICTAAVKS